MKRTGSKAEIITFKVDSDLADKMRSIANRSEFIRHAVLSALNQVCPLCQGSGILDPDEKRHWDIFLRDHGIQHCQDCHAQHLVCLSPSGDERDC